MGHREVCSLGAAFGLPHRQLGDVRVSYASTQCGVIGNSQYRRPVCGIDERHGSGVKRVREGTAHGSSQ